MEESDVITDVRHVCLGAIDLVTNPSVEENNGNDDGFSLQDRLRRLRTRTSIMFRSLRSLKIHFQHRVDNACMDEGFISDINRPCLEPLDFGSSQLSPIHDEAQLLRRLEQDYTSLTMVAGVMELMPEDSVTEQATTMTEANVSVQSTLCELFLTILKIRRNAYLSGQLLESHVSGSGLYNAVVPWCSVRSMVCRDERNFIILSRIVRFVGIFKSTMRAIDI
ncbi:uncharacterized protein LOC117340029 [Pecten maximus]|uniref:uncharacterized protein LOC117340029 n=1 Tax=Pecten maximus TaxID=6579 RepID=UPI0014582AB4|nr:uncharacterized protein LOC117340029 [Pecten maximus]